MAVVNRALPVPAFTVSHPNASAVVITTANLTLTYNGGGNAPYSSSCANPQQGTDQLGGTRVPDYPNGISVVAQPECCDVCDGDEYCECARRHGDCVCGCAGGVWVGVSVWFCGVL
jgi:hypothetical protein